MTAPRTTSLPPPTYRTVASIADELAVSAMTVYRVIDAGDLPAVRVGSTIRVRQVDLDSYLARSRP